MPVLDRNGEPMFWPKVPWSYSALHRFEECELNYRESNFKKNVPFVKSSQMEAGDKVHYALNDYVEAGKPLPPMLQRIGKMIDKLSAGAIAVFPEREVNLTHELEPCGTFDQDVCWRGRLDLTIIRKDAIIIVDYKSSSQPREDFEQLELCALATLIERPKATKVHGLYIYTKHRTREMEPMYRHDIPAYVARMVPRLERLKTARETDKFRAIPDHSSNGGIPYCKWCKVVKCQFNPAHA